MFKDYWKDWNRLAKAEQEFHKKHWLGEIVLTVGGFAVLGAGLAIVGAIENMNLKKKQSNEEVVDEPVEEQAV